MRLVNGAMIRPSIVYLGGFDNTGFRVQCGNSTAGLHPDWNYCGASERQCVYKFNAFFFLRIS